MKINNLKNILKQHWVFYWSGNWPMLDALYENNGDYAKCFKKISGTTIRARADFCYKNTLTVFHSEEEYDRLDKYFRNKFEQDPEFLIRSARGYRQQVNSDLAQLKKIYFAGSNYKNFSNKQLADLFLRARSFFVYNSAIDAYDWLMERVLIPVLAKIVENKLSGKHQDKVAEYVNILITPPRQSVIYKERKLLFSIVRYINKNLLLKKNVKQNKKLEDILRSFPILNKKINNYLRKFVWMPVLVNNPPSTLESVWKEIVSYINGEPLVIKAKRLGDNFDFKIIKQGISIQRNLNLTKREKLLVKGLQAMAWLRTEDYVVMSESSFYVIPLYTEIASRLGLPYKQFKEFTPNEIESGLRKGKIEPRVAKQVLKFGSACLGLNGVYSRIIGQESEKIKSKLVSKITKLKNKKQKNNFRGIIGNKGKLVGRALVARTPAEASKVTTKQILVVASASASFVPALRKAGGVVAEFGGITSHPVIVMREYNRPCLIGVKNIMYYVKTGDQLEFRRGEWRYQYSIIYI